MSGVGWELNTAEIALTAATAKTVIQMIAPTNQREVVTSWGVSFDGASPTAEPVIVELYRLSSAGTMSTLTPAKSNPVDTETLQVTAKHTATAEPTPTDLLRRREVTATGGYFETNQYIPVPGGGRIGIVCTAPAGVNVVASMSGEE